MEAEDSHGDVGVCGVAGCELAVRSVASARSVEDVDDTAALTRAIACGDREAFGAFYDRWFAWSCDRVRESTGRDEAFCLDVVQDAMVKVIGSMVTLPGRAALRAWLSRVLLNTARDRLKAEARRRRRESARGGGGEAESAAAWAARREEIEALGREVARLERTLGALVTARFAMGMTLERAGLFFGLGVGATDRRVRKGLAALRASMDEREEG